MIVDASIVVRWLVPSQLDPRAQKVLQVEPLFAPNFLLAEVGHKLTREVRDRKMTESVARAGWALVKQSVRIRGLVSADAMLDLSLKLHITCFDASYLALAIELDDQVVTADRPFTNAVRAAPEFADRMVYVDEL